MSTNYIDGTGKVVAYFVGDVLYTAKDVPIGTNDLEGNVIAENGETILVAFHEGLYEGPNRPPIAWLQVSEFAQ